MRANKQKRYLLIIITFTHGSGMVMVMEEIQVYNKQNENKERLGTMFSRVFNKVKNIKHVRSVGLGLAGAAALGVGATVHANEDSAIWSLPGIIKASSAHMIKLLYDVVTLFIKMFVLRVIVWKELIIVTWLAFA